MKITYGITLDEFRTLQPPLHRRIGAMGLAVTMGLICLLLIAPALGVVAEELSQGQRPTAAALASIGVGLLLCACAYGLDRRSERRKKDRREQELLAKYNGPPTT